jgi:transposase
LKQSVIDLQEMVSTLQQTILNLQEEIRLLKNGRKSNTSSSPPSQDIGRSNQRSLRDPSNRKSGGQPGHEGSTLKMTQTPDKIIEYRPEYCSSCSEKLDSQMATLVARKQELEIPQILPQYIEHQAYSCTCKRCGMQTLSQLPQRLESNIQYGAMVNALVGYLSVRQYVSYNRIVEIMNDAFNIKLSEGTVDNILQNLAQKALPYYEEIRERVQQSSVVGGDETGLKINGKKGWLFTFQTKTLTFLTVAYSRGFDTIHKAFRFGFPTSVYVTDCWAAQLKTQAQAHQICIAHLLRELTNFIDALDCRWSKQMKQNLLQAIELKEQLKLQDYCDNQPQVTLLETQLDLLLKTELDGKHKKVQAFIKRLNKNRNAIFTFLHNPKVPPDNNASERAIRNVKVKMKVSNQFKAFAGAQRFVVIRSIIDTAIKNSQSALKALINWANLAAE